MALWPNPAVLFLSTTADPLNTVPKASGITASPSKVQFIKSREVEWPHVMFSHCDP